MDDRTGVVPSIELMGQWCPWILSAAPHSSWCNSSASPKLSPTEGSSHHTTGQQLLGQLLLAAMDHLKTRFILSIPFMVLGFLLTRSPFMMTSLAPTKPWADGPMKLITTPQFLTKKVPDCTYTRCIRCVFGDAMLMDGPLQTDIFTSGATHMALLRTFLQCSVPNRHVRDWD